MKTNKMEALNKRMSVLFNLTIKAQRIKQVDVANACGVTGAAVANWCDGSTKIPATAWLTFCSMTGLSTTAAVSSKAYAAQRIILKRALMHY